MIKLLNMESETRQNIQKQLTAIDLFAGAGGFSLGFSMAGFRVTHAIEVDKWAAETFEVNFPRTKVVTRDIQQISDEEIKDIIDERPLVVIGGPPCQGFSHSNVNNKDPKDPRNSLFQEYMRFVAQLRPKVCMIENVKGLLTTKTAKGELVIDIILREFESLGYNADFRVLNAANFGVPQFRERLIIAAVCKSEANNFFWPEPTHELGNSNITSLFEELMPTQPPLTLWEAIGDIQQITHESYTGKEGYECSPLNEFQSIMRRNAPEFLLNHEPMKHTKRVVERYATIGFGESEGDVSEKHLPRKRSESSTISKAYDQNGRRQRPDRPCSTIVASSHSNFIHPFLHRNFTVRELARIQSFPDDYEFRGKRAVLSKKLSIRKGLLDEIYLDQRMQVGNAVPPLFAKALAESVRSTLSLTNSRGGKNEICST
uniref:DNA (cytosine-5-)-methyltransferase n=1 Tax=Brevibacillus brevis TaxID=1393 RepID=Q5D6Y7_BREBE|nr:BbvCI methyltransferase 1 [Brevibacillus brevis]